MDTPNPPETETVADVYDAAADVLLNDGWCQNRLVNEAGQRCVIGGLLGAVGATDIWLVGQSARDAVDRYVGPLADAVPCHPDEHDWLEGCVEWDRLALWNNAPERTEDDVHDLLRNTAKALREEARRG